MKRLEEQEVDQEVIQYIARKITLLIHPLLEQITEEEIGEILSLAP